MPPHNDSEDTPWRDADTLRRLYHDGCMSTREVGEQLGCSYKTILHWMDEFDIERRDRGEKTTHPELKDGELLRKWYCEEGLSGNEIADRIGCASKPAYDALHRHGIEIRSHEDRSAFPKLYDEEWLREKYLEEELSCSEIADLLGCDWRWVLKHLHRHDIPTRERGSEPGEDNPNWKGGWEEYYGPNWETQRQRALERDGFVCRVCGMTREDHREAFGDDLTVHHIRPVREFKSELDAPEWYQSANELDNLVTLCRPDHLRWEGIPVAPQPATN